MATPSKYTVSFNSDTSDSEESEEESTEEEETEEEETDEEGEEIIIASSKITSQSDILNGSSGNQTTSPLQSDDVTEVSFSLAPTAARSPSPAADEDACAAEFTLDFSFDASVVNGETSTPDTDHQETPQFTFSVETSTEEVTQHVDQDDDIKAVDSASSKAAAEMLVETDESISQNSSLGTEALPASAALVPDSPARVYSQCEGEVGTSSQTPPTEETQPTLTPGGSAPCPGSLEQGTSNLDQIPAAAEGRERAISSQGVATEGYGKGKTNMKLDPDTAAQESADVTLSGSSNNQREIFEEGQKENIIVNMVVENEGTEGIKETMEGENSVCVEESKVIVDASKNLETNAVEKGCEDLSDAKNSPGGDIALDRFDIAELGARQEVVSSADEILNRDAALQDKPLQDGSRSQEQKTNLESISFALDKQTEGAADKSTSLSRVRGRGDALLKGGPARHIALSESAPLQSPARKSLSDDDFEARISRAKAFIESTNGRLSQGEDKSEGKFGANFDISSSASERSSEMAMDADDQYILGTVAVTTGSKKGKDLYTEEDILARPARGRKVIEEEPPREEPSSRDKYVSDVTDDTNELIKRILAEARGEVYEPPKRRAIEEDEGSEIVDDEISETGSTYTRRKRYNPSEDKFGSMSLLERRIESMKKRNAELAADDFDPRKTKRQLSSEAAAQDDSNKQMVVYDPNRDDDALSTTSSASRASAIRRKYHRNWGAKHQECFDDDDVFVEPGAGALVPYVPIPDEDQGEDDDNEDSLYKTRKALRRGLRLPDEAFIPRKSEDTDEIVQEKTMNIRNVVSKQETVLESLRKASQSFDEIEDEIKEIRQQFYESQEKRAIIQEEIEYDLQLAKQHEEELAAQAYVRKYAPPPAIDYTKGYIPSNLYSTPKAIKWETERDLDQGPEPLSNTKGLAIKSSGWTGPGTRLTSSASLDYAGESTFESESQSSMPSYRPRQRPSSGRRQQRSMYDRSRTRSLMEDYDRESDFGDDASSRISKDTEEVETMDGDVENGDRERKGGLPPWKSGLKMNGDDGRDFGSWKGKPLGGEVEGEGNAAEELSAKINSWRAKVEQDTAEAGLGGTSVLHAWRAANKDGYATSLPGRSQYATANDDIGDNFGGQPRSTLLNNNLDDSEDLGAYSWRSRGNQAEGATGKGAFSWRSKYGSSDDNVDTGPGLGRSKLNDPEDTNDQGAYSWRSSINNSTDPLSNSPYSSWRSKANIMEDSNDLGAYSHRPKVNDSEDPLANDTTYSWRNKMKTEVNGLDEAGDTGAHSWRSRLNNPDTTPSTKPYSWRKNLDTNAENDEDSSASGLRSKYGHYGKTYSADDSDTTPSYSSPSSYGYSARLGRSSTLSDYSEYQRPDRRARARSCEPGSGTGFRSKFLNKVREKKAAGESSEGSSKPRDKPFKSRFLKSSFGGTDSGSTPEQPAATSEA